MHYRGHSELIHRASKIGWVYNAVNETYLANVIIGDQDIPSSQVSMYEALLG